MSQAPVKLWADKKQCWVPNCGNYEGGGYANNFFLLPEDSTHREVWVAATGKSFPSSSEWVYFCECHFNKSDDMDAQSDAVFSLKTAAVPYLHMPEKVCRTCMSIISSKEPFFVVSGTAPCSPPADLEIDLVTCRPEPLYQVLTFCIPDVTLDRDPPPIVCSKCYHNIWLYFGFKLSANAVEKELCGELTPEEYGKKVLCRSCPQVSGTSFFLLSEQTSMGRLMKNMFLNDFPTEVVPLKICLKCWNIVYKLKHFYAQYHFSNKMIQQRKAMSREKLDSAVQYPAMVDDNVLAQFPSTSGEGTTPLARGELLEQEESFSLVGLSELKLALEPEINIEELATTNDNSGDNKLWVKSELDVCIVDETAEVDDKKSVDLQSLLVSEAAGATSDLQAKATSSNKKPRLTTNSPFNEEEKILLAKIMLKQDELLKNYHFNRDVKTQVNFEKWVAIVRLFHQSGYTRSMNSLQRCWSLMRKSATAAFETIGPATYVDQLVIECVKSKVYQSDSGVTKAKQKPKKSKPKPGKSCFDVPKRSYRKRVVTTAVSPKGLFWTYEQKLALAQEVRKEFEYCLQHNKVPVGKPWYRIMERIVSRGFEDGNLKRVYNAWCRIKLSAAMHDKNSFDDVDKQVWEVLEMHREYLKSKPKKSQKIPKAAAPEDESVTPAVNDLRPTSPAPSREEEANDGCDSEPPPPDLAEACGTKFKRTIRHAVFNETEKWRLFNHAKREYMLMTKSTTRYPYAPWLKIIKRLVKKYPCYKTHTFYTLRREWKTLRKSAELHKGTGSMTVLDNKVLQLLQQDIKMRKKMFSDNVKAKSRNASSTANSGEETCDHKPKKLKTEPETTAKSLSTFTENEQLELVERMEREYISLLKSNVRYPYAPWVLILQRVIKKYYKTLSFSKLYNREWREYRKNAILHANTENMTILDTKVSHLLQLVLKVRQKIEKDAPGHDAASTSSQPKLDPETSNSSTETKPDLSGPVRFDEAEKLEFINHIEQEYTLMLKSGTKHRWALWKTLIQNVHLKYYENLSLDRIYKREWPDVRNTAMLHMNEGTMTDLDVKVTELMKREQKRVTHERKVFKSNASSPKIEPDCKSEAAVNAVNLPKASNVGGYALRDCKSKAGIGADAAGSDALAKASHVEKYSLREPKRDTNVARIKRGSFDGTEKLEFLERIKQEYMLVVKEQVKYGPSPWPLIMKRILKKYYYETCSFGKLYKHEWSTLRGQANLYEKDGIVSDFGDKVAQLLKLERETRKKLNRGETVLFPEASTSCQPEANSDRESKMDSTKNVSRSRYHKHKPFTMNEKFRFVKLMKEELVSLLENGHRYHIAPWKLIVRKLQSKYYKNDSFNNLYSSKWSVMRRDATKHENSPQATHLDKKVLRLLKMERLKKAPMPPIKIKETKTPVIKTKTPTTWTQKQKLELISVIRREGEEVFKKSDRQEFWQRVAEAFNRKVPDKFTSKRVRGCWNVMLSSAQMAWAQQKEVDDYDQIIIDFMSDVIRSKKKDEQAEEEDAHVDVEVYEDGEAREEEVREAKGNEETREELAPAEDEEVVDVEVWEANEDDGDECEEYSSPEVVEEANESSVELNYDYVSLEELQMNYEVDVIERNSEQDTLPEVVEIEDSDAD